jgi:hypothetical protein
MSKGVEIVWRSRYRGTKAYHANPLCGHIGDRATYRREVAEGWENLDPCEDCWETEALGDPNLCSICGEEIPEADGECPECKEMLSEDYFDE